MPSDSSNSARSSAPTSRNAPASPPSEDAFLTKQANDAKAAISRVGDELTKDLAQTVDPRAWVRTAPWTTLAVTAVASFAAIALIPTKEQRAERRLRRVEEALEEQKRRRDRNGHDDPSDDEAPGRTSGSLLKSLAGHAFNLLQPMLTTAITAVLSSKAAAPPAPTGSQTAQAQGQSPPTPDI